MQQQIPPIKITIKGETYYFINRATNTTNLRQPLNEDQECSAINEIEMEASQNNEENKINSELTHQDESWKMVSSNKKRKITPGTSAAGNLDTGMQRWLQELSLRNSFSSLMEEIDADPTSKTTSHSTHITKPPPIFVEIQIIDPLINLLSNIIEKDNYTIKQTKL